MAWVAVQSGEAFYQRLGMPAFARAPTELGDSMHVFALGPTVALLVLGLLARRQQVARAVVVLCAVLVILTAGLVIWRVVLVGHSGSTAVWGDIVENTEAPAG